MIWVIHSISVLRYSNIIDRILKSVSKRSFFNIFKTIDNIFLSPYFFFLHRIQTWHFSNFSCKSFSYLKFISYLNVIFSFLYMPSCDKIWYIRVKYRYENNITVTYYEEYVVHTFYSMYSIGKANSSAYLQVLSPF